MLNLSSANAFNLNQSRIFSFGKELIHKIAELKSYSHSPWQQNRTFQTPSAGP